MRKKKDNSLVAKKTVPGAKEYTTYLSSRSWDDRSHLSEDLKKLSFAQKQKRAKKLVKLVFPTKKIVVKVVDYGDVFTEKRDGKTRSNLIELFVFLWGGSEEGGFTFDPQLFGGGAQRYLPKRSACLLLSFANNTSMRVCMG